MSAKRQRQVAKRKKIDKRKKQVDNPAGTKLAKKTKKHKLGIYDA